MSTVSAPLVKPLLVILLAAAGHGAGAEYAVKLSKIGESLDGHSTTRTTVRRVFRHDGHWYVFCGDVRDKVYSSYFVTSTDGVSWSEAKTGSGGGVAGGEFGAPNLPETAIVHGDRIYGCYREDGQLRIRRGTPARGDITWEPGFRVDEGYLDRSTKDFYGYYPDIMVEEDGRLSISLRHHRLSGETSRLNPAFVVSAKPGGITSWQAPVDLIDLQPPEKHDAHENIPLPGGKRVVIVRSCWGSTDEELYKPGTPGAFYAVHYDGEKWLEPVRLGASDGVNGSDKRLSAMSDPGTGIVHLTYIEDSGTHWKNELRHRALAPPYGIGDWSAPAVVASNVFTVMLGMDASSNPARIAAVYGEQLHEGGESDPAWGSRWHTGKLYLKWFDGTEWETGRQLISEEDEEYAWYPSVQEDASGAFGVLYMKGGFEEFRTTPKELMFALIEPGGGGQ